MLIACNDDNYDDSNKFFEYWSHLAATDSERFELERLIEIEKVISQAAPSHQQGLKQLQWRIDMERRRAKNPIDGMVRLQKMMWRQFYAEEGFVFAVKQLVKVCHITEGLIKESVTSEAKEAAILPFKKD